MKARLSVSFVAVAIAVAGCSGPKERPTLPDAPTATSEASDPGTSEPPVTPTAQETATEETTSTASGTVDPEARALLDAAVSRFLDAQSYHQEVEMSSAVDLGGSAPITTTGTVSSDIILSPAVQLGMLMNTEALGQAINLEIYAVQEGESTRVYQRDDATGAWVTYVTSDLAAITGGAAIDPMNEVLRVLPADAPVSMVAVEHNGAPATEVTVTVSDEVLAEALAASTPGVIFEDVTATVTYTIDDATGDPVAGRTIVDGSISSTGQAGTMHSETVTEFSNFDGITEIPLPAEAANATEIDAPVL